MIFGLTRDVPTLRRVIAVDPVGGDAVSFEDLLSSPALVPQEGSASTRPR